MFGRKNLHAEKKSTRCLNGREHGNGEGKHIHPLAILRQPLCIQVWAGVCVCVCVCFSSPIFAAFFSSSLRLHFSTFITHPQASRFLGKRASWFSQLIRIKRMRTGGGGYGDRNGTRRNGWQFSISCFSSSFPSEVTATEGFLRLWANVCTDRNGELLFLRCFPEPCPFCHCTALAVWA